MTTVDHERADLMVNVGALPQSQLRVQKKVKGWGTYLVAELNAEVLVLSDVKFIIRRGGIIAETYNTRL